MPDDPRDKYFLAVLVIINLLAIIAIAMLANRTH
jgi:hypothetical protein